MKYLVCQERNVKLNLTQEKLSMLIMGGSRMGKTFFMSLHGKALIDAGEAVHLIDLGDKWSNDDKKRIGIPLTESKTGIIKIYFPSKESLQGSARYIANAIGYSSAEIISVLKRALKELLRRYPTGFSIIKLVEFLESQIETNPIAGKVYERLDSETEIPDFELLINSEHAERIAHSNIIWDLSCCEGCYVNILCQLVVFALYETKKQWFRRDAVHNKKLFVMIDEFQNIDCTQKSVLGKCLTEGQKYKIYTVLATQFLQGKFSEAVINQFKQGGFRIYFRMTEEEASVISKQLVYDIEEQKKLKRILCTLPQGHFLLKGSHYIGTNQDATERLRVVEAKQKVQTKIFATGVSPVKPTKKYYVNGVEGS